MVRVVVTICMVMVTAIVLLFPAFEIEPMRGAACGTLSAACDAQAAPGESFSIRIEGDLHAIEAAAAAVAGAAVSSVRTLICLGETTVEVYRVLNGPPPAKA